MFTLGESLSLSSQQWYPLCVRTTAGHNVSWVLCSLKKAKVQNNDFYRPSPCFLSSFRGHFYTLLQHFQSFILKKGNQWHSLSYGCAELTLARKLVHQSYTRGAVQILLSSIILPQKSKQSSWEETSLLYSLILNTQMCYSALTTDCPLHLEFYHQSGERC